MQQLEKKKIVAFCLTITKEVQSFIYAQCPCILTSTMNCHLFIITCQPYSQFYYQMHCINFTKPTHWKKCYHSYNIFFQLCKHTSQKHYLSPKHKYVFLNYLPCNFPCTTLLSSFPIFLCHRSCLTLFITFRFMCTSILKTTRHHHPHISKKIK